jgi:beta-lactamase superfamily II metal-dependent hydrolase
VPHHGSRRNNNLDLLRAIESREFPFSSNANRTKHPDKESVAQVLHTFEDPQLWFNYKTAFNDVWGQAHVERRFGYRAQYGNGTTADDLD